MALPHRDQDGDRVRHQPAGGERDRVGRGGVQPVGIIHRHEQWPRLGVGRDEVQHGGADDQPVGLDALAQAERRA